MKCPHCSHENREGSLLCDNCGKSLVNLVAALATKVLDSPETEGQQRGGWGTALFRKTVVLHIQDYSEPLVVQVEKALTFGRADVNSSQQPDLDLVRFGAVDKGVSRVHAKIEHRENTLTLIDLGSSNGTFLNGQRLIPEQPRLLRDGDAIRLGRLTVNIYFK